MGLINPIDTSIATIICALIAAIGTTITTVITSHNKAISEKEKIERAIRQKQVDARADATEVMLSCALQYMTATGAATRVLLLNARGDKINGNVENALQKLDDAGCAYNSERDKLASDALMGNRR